MEEDGFPVFASETAIGQDIIPTDLPSEQVEDWCNARRVSDYLHALWNTNQHRAQVLMHQLTSMPRDGSGVDAQQYPVLLWSGFLVPAGDDASGGWRPAVQNLRAISCEVVDVEHSFREGFRLRPDEEAATMLRDRLSQLGACACRGVPTPQP